MFRNICLSPYKSCKVLEDILQLKAILINLWLIVAVIHRYLKLSHVISKFTFPTVIGATENKKKNLKSQWELSEFSDFFSCAFCLSIFLSVYWVFMPGVTSMFWNDIISQHVQNHNFFVVHNLSVYQTFWDRKWLPSSSSWDYAYN